MSDKSDDNKLDSDECILPPDHPLPADELARYSPVRDYYAETDIADYIHSQARDETVQNVERVKSEYVAGTRYEIWDVKTDKDRWWVITNPTNLYSQRHFPSLDYTLSFHVGLMMRVASRAHREVPEGTPFDEVFRRQSQAEELLERAIEAVDLQAVGMQLRECLISLVATVRRRVEITGLQEYPKDADVVGWGRLFAAHFWPGGRNDDLRSYLRSVIEKTWPLVNWLTHHRNARKIAAVIAVDAVGTIVKHFVNILMLERSDRPDECPRCASRNIQTFFDINIAPDGAYFEVCNACKWDSHPGLEEFES